MVMCVVVIYYVVNIGFRVVFIIIKFWCFWSFFVLVFGFIVIVKKFLWVYEVVSVLKVF